MLGLNFKEYQEIINMVQAYHPFVSYQSIIELENIKKAYPNYINYHIKYVNSVYDTRSMTYWNITFRNGGMEINFSTSNIPTNPNSIYHKYEKMYDMIMDFLKGNITDFSDIKIK